MINSPIVIFYNWKIILSLTGSTAHNLHVIPSKVLAQRSAEDEACVLDRDGDQEAQGDPVEEADPCTARRGPAEPLVPESGRRLSAAAS